jgi:hypothetical protein
MQRYRPHVEPLEERSLPSSLGSASVAVSIVPQSNDAYGSANVCRELQTLAESARDICLGEEEETRAQVSAVVQSGFGEFGGDVDDNAHRDAMFASLALNAARSGAVPLPAPTAQTAASWGFVERATLFAQEQETLFPPVIGGVGEGIPSHSQQRILTPPQQHSPGTPSVRQNHQPPEASEHNTTQPAENGAERQRMPDGRDVPPPAAQPQQGGAVEEEKNAAEEPGNAERRQEEGTTRFSWLKAATATVIAGVGSGILGILWKRRSKRTSATV